MNGVRYRLSDFTLQACAARYSRLADTMSDRGEKRLGEQYFIGTHSLFLGLNGLRARNYLEHPRKGLRGST